MENPMTWGPAEKIVSRVLDEADNILPEFIDHCGLSLPRRITDALREAGLLEEESEEEKNRRVEDHQADRPTGRPQEPEVRDGAVV